MWSGIYCIITSSELDVHSCYIPRRNQTAIFITLARLSMDVKKAYLKLLSCNLQHYHLHLQIQYLLILAEIGLQFSHVISFYLIITGWKDWAHNCSKWTAIGNISNCLSSDVEIYYLTMFIKIEL